MEHLKEIVWVILGLIGMFLSEQYRRSVKTDGKHSWLIIAAELADHAVDWAENQWKNSPGLEKAGKALDFVLDALEKLGMDRSPNMETTLKRMIEAAYYRKLKGPLEMDKKLAAVLPSSPSGS